MGHSFPMYKNHLQYVQDGNFYTALKLIDFIIYLKQKSPKHPTLGWLLSLVGWALSHVKLLTTLFSLLIYSTVCKDRKTKRKEKPIHF